MRSLINSGPLLSFLPPKKSDCIMETSKNTERKEVENYEGYRRNADRSINGAFYDVHDPVVVDNAGNRFHIFDRWSDWTVCGGFQGTGGLLRTVVLLSQILYFSAPIIEGGEKIMNEIQKHIAELEKQKKELQGEISKVKSFSKKLNTGGKILGFIPKLEELGVVKKLGKAFTK